MGCQISATAASIRNMEASSRRIIVIYMLYVAAHIVATKADDFPLDSGPMSYQQKVPPSQANLPASVQLRPRTMADLDSLEAALASLPGQPIEVRKKFSNANPTSLAIAKAARKKEWARMFALGT